MDDEREQAMVLIRRGKILLDRHGVPSNKQWVSRAVVTDGIIISEGRTDDVISIYNSSQAAVIKWYPRYKQLELSRPHLMPVVKAEIDRLMILDDLANI